MAQEHFVKLLTLCFHRASWQFLVSPIVVCDIKSGPNTPNGSVSLSSPSFKGLADDWVTLRGEMSQSLARVNPRIITHTQTHMWAHSFLEPLASNAQTYTHAKNYMHTHFIWMQNSHQHSLHTHTLSLLHTHAHDLSQFQRGWWGGIYSGRWLIESEVDPSCRSVGLPPTWPRDDKQSTSARTSSLNTHTHTHTHTNSNGFTLPSYTLTVFK